MAMTAFRMLLRDWRAGELGVLLAALVIAVATVAGIAAFTGRLQAALEQESHRFLAADKVVQSSRELPASWRQEAQARGVAAAQTLSFPSMVYVGEDKMYLASIKAVSDGYPLRGQLTFSDQPFGEVRVASAGPNSGEVWLDSRLFPLLQVAIGDSVTIGEASFKVAAAARSEPDQSSSMFGYGPRVLMHLADIPATGVVRPGSRVQHRLLFAGSEQALLDLEAWLRPQFKDGQQWRGIDSAQPGVGRALRRAEQFLLLAGSLAVILAGVAIALAARRFSERHNDYVAILKSLGATAAHINRLYAANLLLIGFCAAVLGCSLGWCLQALFFALFSDALPIAPANSGPLPYVLGAATAFVSLLSFAWPPLGRLAAASPLRVLRRDMPITGQRSVADFGLGLLSVTLLMWWYSGDLRLTAAILAGLAVSVVVGSALALVMLRGGRVLGMRAGSIWRLALAGLQRRGSSNAIQVVIFAMAIMMMLILVLVRSSLIDDWRAQLPVGAPNHFMINISAAQVQSVESLLQYSGIDSEPLYPMVRGRLMSINGEDLTNTGDAEQGRRQRETNLTWSAQLPEGNTLLEGHWWPVDISEPVVSVEQGFAQRLRINIDDQLEFRVGSQPLTARVTSIRSLQWQSMRPNFFLVFPRQSLLGYPATFMTSFFLPADNKPFLNELIRRFPTTTVIEMDIVVEQIRQIVGQVTAAIELVLLIILATGALVLIAGVQSSVDSRMHESAILRALGARRRLLLGGLLIEFAVLGLCAGILAVVGAECSVYLLQTRVLDMSYSPNPELWPLGLAAGSLIIASLGVWSCRSVVSTSPLRVLREL